MPTVSESLSSWSVRPSSVVDGSLDAKGRTVATPRLTLFDFDMPYST